MPDGVQTTAGLAGRVGGEAVPRGHVREQARHVVVEVALPQQPVVREADSLVEAALVDVAKARRDVGVLPAHLVGVELRRQALPTPLPVRAGLVAVAGPMRTRQADVA